MKRNYFFALAACALLGSASAEAAAAPSAGGSNQTELAFQAQPGVWVFRDATTGKTLKGAVAPQHLQAIRAELASRGRPTACRWGGASRCSTSSTPTAPTR